MNIKFTSLKKADLELLFLWFKIPHVKRWYARGEQYTLDRIKKKYLPRLNNPDIPNFIVTLQDEPIGYIQLYHLDKQNLPEGVQDYQHPIFSKFEPKDIVGLDFFIANEDCLHKGIASRVLHDFISQFIGKKISAIVVDPKKNNHQAIKFFERNRFVKLELNDNDSHQLMLYTL